MIKIALIKDISRLFLIFVSILLFSGCTRNNNIILKTYSPPDKRDKVKELMAKSTSNVSYLDLYINEDAKSIKYILNNKTNDKAVAQMLLANVKRYLTQTNFIGINQDTNSNTVSLQMQIVGYSYHSTSTTINAFLEVAFDFIKDTDEKSIHSPVFHAKLKRQSKAGKQALPSKSEVLSILTKDIASSLILDVSPLKARKLVTLKSLPKELMYTIKYAKMKNYKGAIKAMQEYKGEKTMEYYYNLAVYYEALASTQSDISLLKYADENYELAMSMGGTTDELVIKTKAKFDNFYELIKEIDKQKKSNNNSDLNRDNEIL